MFRRILIVPIGVQDALFDLKSNVDIVEHLLDVERDGHFVTFEWVAPIGVFLLKTGQTWWVRTECATDELSIVGRLLLSWNCLLELGRHLLQEKVTKRGGLALTIALPQGFLVLTPTDCEKAMHTLDVFFIVIYLYADMDLVLLIVLLEV